MKKPRRNRIDRLTTAWMVLAAVVALIAIIGRGVIPQAWWVSIHVITLGVLSNAILQWSWYFSRSLLRLPADDRHSGRDQLIRQLLFNGVLVLLVASMMTANLVGTLVGASGIGLILAWHGLALVIASRARLASRFAVVIRYYVAAAAFFVVGCIYAGLVATTMYSAAIPDWFVNARSALTLSHSLVNGLGWIGLSIAGTLVTLWPTVLHTRITPGAARQATTALPLLIVALLATVIAATFSLMTVAGISVGAFVVCLMWGIGIPLFHEVSTRSPHDYAGWAMIAGICWAFVGLAVLAVQLIASPDPDAFRLVASRIIAVIGVAGILQILVGALTYLMPVVIGGGPQAVRVGIAQLNKGSQFRLVIKNAALVFAAVSPIQPEIFWLIVLASNIADIIAFSVAGVFQARQKRAVQLSFPSTAGENA